MSETKKWYEKLWNGEYPLAKAYWGFGVLYNLGLAAAYIAIGTVLVSITPILGATFLGIGAVALLAYSILAYIGIWRSATAYTGPKKWAILTKIVLVIGALQMIGQMGAIMQELNSF